MAKTCVEIGGPAKVDRQMQGKDKSQQRDDERKNPNVPISPGEQHEQQSPDKRRKCHKSKDVVIERVHRTPIQIMNAITNAEPAAIHPA